MAFSPNPILFPRSRRSAGFTLVEVTLALGIIAFAFIALLALLPAGNTAFRRAIDLATCSQIAQRIIGDAQNADFSVLTQVTTLSVAPTPGTSITLDPRYFDDQGREIIPLNPKSPTKDETLRAVYYVNTRVIPVAPLPRNSARTVRTDLNTQAGEIAPTNPLAQVTVQIIHNPNGLPVTPDTSSQDDVNKAERNLVANGPTTQRKLDIFTYSALIGRNN